MKIRGVSYRLLSRMNSVAFCASSEKITPCWLATTPTGKPWIDPQPVRIDVPYIALYSSKREPSRVRARISRMSNGTRRSEGMTPRISSASCTGGSGSLVGP